MENPYLPYAAPQGIPDPDFHSAMHPVQNTVPEFDNIFDHAVTVWKANLWMLIAATLIAFLVIPFGFNIASATVQGLVNSVENPILAMIFGVILTTVAIVLNVFLGVGSTKFSIQVTFVWVRLGIRDSVYGTKSRIQCMVQKVELRVNEQFCMTRHC